MMTHGTFVEVWETIRFLAAWYIHSLGTFELGLAIAFGPLRILPAPRV